MEINSNNIRVVIHAEAPMTNLIQEAGRVGCDRNTAMHAIFFIWKYQGWPDEEKPPVCEKCDNCIKRTANRLKLIDGKEEIIKLLEVVEFPTQEEQVSLDDVVDVFRGGKTMRIKQKKWDTLPVFPMEKRKVLKTKELVQFALADLVVRNIAKTI
ncbi:hypothetical protein C1645_842247 [Glomus cerebriforme]|uniref:RQC domain-containing protein n=1 Tax=Glomus cerebriforme TaxID=658196 RepID=A0A397RWW1_9GLOM|nr:hypothetical protein C1645_842247 [Glomus cerebriforme]